MRRKVLLPMSIAHIGVAARAAAPAITETITRRESAASSETGGSDDEDAR